MFVKTHPEGAVAEIVEIDPAPVDTVIVTLLRDIDTELLFNRLTPVFGSSNSNTFLPVSPKVVNDKSKSTPIKFPSTFTVP